MKPSPVTSSKRQRRAESDSNRKSINPVFSLSLPLVLISVAWIIEICDQIFIGGSFNLPVTPGGPWWGILTAPFSHADWGHLIGNTLYFVPLSYLVLLNGLSHYIAVWGCVVFLNLFKLLFWPRGSHGMSGVVYGLVGYLLVIGIAERRPLSIALTVFAFVTYSHFVPTLLPWVSPPGVSWIGHFLGFTGGVIAALGMFREDHKSPKGT